jgi:NADPH:quinone reductase
MLSPSDISPLISLGCAKGSKHGVESLIDFYHNLQRLIGVDTLKLTGPEIAKIMDDLRAGFEDGHLRPSSVQTWTLDQGIDAYAAVEKGVTSSKHVLLPRRY